MFLLNKKMIEKYIDQKLLYIGDFEPGLLHPTYYYLRIGRYVQKWDEKENNFAVVDIGRSGKVLEIPPRGYVSIQSLESFNCFGKVLGIFGQISDLPTRGLRLNHSPTIDPTFDGVLYMGIENLLERPVELKYGDRIAKVLFFDISDTYPIDDIKNSVSASKYEQRKSATL